MCRSEGGKLNWELEARAIIAIYCWICFGEENEETPHRINVELKVSGKKYFSEEEEASDSTLPLHILSEFKSEEHIFQLLDPLMAPMQEVIH